MSGADFGLALDNPRRNAVRYAAGEHPQGLQPLGMEIGASMLFAGRRPKESAAVFQRKRGSAGLCGRR